MKPVDFSGDFTITAHTGRENTPQNSIESVEKAVVNVAPDAALPVYVGLY